MRTADFPWRNDPDGQTWDAPPVSGMTPTNVVNPGPLTPPGPLVTNGWNAAGLNPSNMQQTAPSSGWGAYAYMPPNSWHTQRSSSGIPATFPFFSNTLTVNGVAQSTKRSVIADGTGNFPATLWNLNNAARNLLEIIADAARSDAGGDYPVRIYTIGMGFLVSLQLGTMPETPASILQRIANDPASPDHNPAQRDGAFFYAPTANDVSKAYAGIQNQILRLSK
jgi:hypothetical protein